MNNKFIISFKYIPTKQEKAIDQVFNNYAFLPYDFNVLMLNHKCDEAQMKTKSERKKICEQE